jgi:hypothetical protein
VAAPAFSAIFLASHRTGKGQKSNYNSVRIHNVHCDVAVTLLQQLAKVVAVFEKVYDA